MTKPLRICIHCKDGTESTKDFSVEGYKKGDKHIEATHFIKEEKERLKLLGKQIEMIVQIMV